MADDLIPVDYAIDVAVAWPNQRIDLAQLKQALANAGIVVAALGIDEFSRVHTYDALAQRKILPSTAVPVIQGFVAPPPLTSFTAQQPITGKVRTTDATATEVYRLTLAATTGYAFNAQVIGVDAGNGAIRVIRASVAAKRLNAGALLIGSPVVYANHADTAASTWGGVSVLVSGNDLVVQVTGLAARTIDWNLTGDVTRFAPAGLT